MPASITGKFAGTAQAYQETLNNMHWLLIAAFVAV